LDRDPDRRPPSALAVAAALPGGDPLAEALAAGETPSPELLVAAGEANALPMWQALTIVVAIGIPLIAMVPLGMPSSPVRLAPAGKSAAVLVDRAEQILTSVGYTEPRADSTYGFAPNDSYLTWIARTDQSPRRWSVLAQGNPTAVAFYYRT